MSVMAYSKLGELQGTPNAIMARTICSQSLHGGESRGVEPVPQGARDQSRPGTMAHLGSSSNRDLPTVAPGVAIFWAAVVPHRPASIVRCLLLLFLYRTPVS